MARNTRADDRCASRTIAGRPTSLLTLVQLLGDRADELTKWQADVELRDKERVRAREAREQQQALNNWSAWDGRTRDHLKAHDEVYNECVGKVIGIRCRQVSEAAHRELMAEITTLRDELKAATSKLHDEINTRFARLPLEVKTWEPVGEALDQIRQQAHEQAQRR